MSLLLVWYEWSILTSIDVCGCPVFPNNTGWKDYLFSIIYTCLLYGQRLTDHRCAVYFGTSVFIPLVYMSLSVPISRRIDYYSFVVLSGSLEGLCLHIVLFPNKSSNYLFHFCEKSQECFNMDCIKSVDWCILHYFNNINSSKTK